MRDDLWEGVLCSRMFKCKSLWTSLYVANPDTRFLGLYQMGGFLSRAYYTMMWDLLQDLAEGSYNSETSIVTLYQSIALFSPTEACTVWQKNSKAWHRCACWYCTWRSVSTASTTWCQWHNIPTTTALLTIWIRTLMLLNWTKIW